MPQQSGFDNSTTVKAMPSVDQILANLSFMANDWCGVAVLWHVYFAVITALVVAGHSSKRMIGLSLTVRLLSVGILAWIRALLHLRFGSRIGVDQLVIWAVCHPDQSGTWRLTRDDQSLGVKNTISEPPEGSILGQDM